MKLHLYIAADNYLFAQLIGFTTGVAISALLLVLTFRAARLPGTPAANVLLAMCGLFWNTGGVAHVCLLVAGVAPTSRFALAAAAVQFSGAAAWPVPMLGIWLDRAALRWRRIASRIVRVGALASAVTILILLWAGVALGANRVPWLEVKEFTSFNAAALLGLGAAIQLRGASISRAMRISAFTILIAVLASASAVAAARLFAPNKELAAGLLLAGEQSVLFLLFGAFFLFTKFRFADVFIRHSVRVLLAGVAAFALALVSQSSILSGVASQSAFPRTTRLFGIALAAGLLLFAFSRVDALMREKVNAWIFRVPDYRAAINQLTERLSQLHAESDIAAAVEDTVRSTLGLNDAKLISTSRIPLSRLPAGLLQGEIIELSHENILRESFPITAEFLVPVASSGRITHALLLSTGSGAGLFTHELSFLRVVASQCGSRLDALERERDMIERRTREALLLQQITEAELRTLRAQVNPHFLFNSLTTLADLIARDPRRAEAMTLRLARVFRHVLAHSSRPLTLVRDEIEFLRTYLSIEEARFGNRLQVQIEVADEVSAEPIPSLILQPLVENALKHGLGPKPGQGHLWISAQPRGDHLCVIVEDDGIGPKSPPRAVRGVGLTNVAERLRTLYHERATLKFEGRKGGGSLVTVLIPRGNIAA